MNADILLANFENVARAPNGVLKLRELFLCLAMQGKLVQQNPKEISADRLLEEVEREKQRLATQNIIKPLRELIPIAPREMSYTLPASWRWVRFGTIALHNSGKTLDKQRNKGIPRDYITTSNLYWGEFDLRHLRQMLIDDSEMERCTVKKGDLLICEGGEAGRAAVWEQPHEVSFQNHVHRARFYCGINPYFAFRFFQKLNATGEINQYRKGVGISSMSGKVLASIVLPLPPLAEQNRIVAKVDQLMALCDKLEEQHQELQRLSPVLSRSCNDSFVGSPSPGTLERIFDKKGALSTGDLRNSIITLAVQGKLVPQKQCDEIDYSPIDEMLKNRRGYQKWAGPITQEEMPFQLPPSWKWFRLGDVSSLKHGYAFSSAYFTAEPSRFVVTTPGNFFEKGGFRDRGGQRRYYSGPVDPEFILKSGDLIIPMTEQAAGLLGSPAFIPDDGRIYLHNQRLGKIGFSEVIIPEFGFLFFNSEYFRGELARTCTGMKVRHTSPDRVLKVLFPVVPLAEQRRVVAKVNELMALVDKFEIQKAEKDRLAEAFAVAAVATITGNKIEKSEPMKAPKTELITKLNIGSKPNARDEAPLAKLIAKQNGAVSAKSLWQQSGLEIDAFYQQLKVEIGRGWVTQPVRAEMKTLEQF